MHSKAFPSGNGQHQNAWSGSVKAALDQAVSRSRQRNTAMVRKIAEEKYRVPTALLPHNVEVWEMMTEDTSSQCYLPFRIVTPAGASSNSKALPCVIMLHPTGGDMNYHVSWESEFVSRGYMTVSMDCRYHGKRQDSSSTYQESLVRAYFDDDSEEKPFLLDNVWDLQHILDHLETRHDINMAKIGITGMSLGGMVAWFSASLDDRIHASAILCGAQYFGYAIEHECYHDRVMSIPEVFRAVATKRGDPGTFPYNVQKDTVRDVWNRLLPGMLELYDADKSLAAIAPRPLLIVTGAEDPRNPIQGVEIVYSIAQKGYKDCGAEANIELFAEKGAGHEFTNTMKAKINSWMDEHLLYSK